MTASADESTAWAAALGGDSRAFASLFDLHYDRVFRHVTGMTDQRADADEVCGAAFLELWRSRARVRLVSGSVLPWLLVTASNLARNHGRKAQRYRRVLSALPRDLSISDPGTDVEEEQEQHRRATLLHQSLKRLKPIDAQLIDLTTRAGLPIQEAAEILGLTAGAARVRLHRVRAHLRERLCPELDPSYPTEDR